jgi:O-methyltransferase involved in polyketide biosynthesis
VIWEGVTQYLSEEAVRRTLAFVGTMASGSLLVFTYVLKSIIERRSDVPGASEMMDVVAKNAAPWIFGLEPSEVSAFLKPFRLDLRADVGNVDYQGTYLEPLKRELVVSDVERVVVALVHSEDLG